jgi:hypothetical protein
VRSCLKNKNKSKGVGGITQMVECLPSTQETLGLIPSTTKENKQNSSFYYTCYLEPLVYVSPW